MEHSSLIELTQKLQSLSMIQHTNCHVCFKETNETNKHLIYKYLNQLLCFFVQGKMPIVIIEIINAYIIQSMDIQAALCRECYSVVMCKENKKGQPLKKRNFIV